MRRSAAPKKGNPFKKNIKSDRFGSKGKDHRCLMVGLDACGKTTILYRMKLGEIVTKRLTLTCDSTTSSTR